MATRKKPNRARARLRFAAFENGNTIPVKLEARGEPRTGHTTSDHYLTRGYVVLNIEHVPGFYAAAYLAPETAERFAADILEAVRVAKSEPPASPPPEVA